MANAITSTTDAVQSSVREALESLITAAVLAPSGDNTQPWRFVLDPQACRIAVHLDRARDCSPMNAGQRMSRIAVGAALENMLRTAEAQGWNAELQFTTEPDSAAILFSGVNANCGPIDELIVERVTNRQLYDGRPILHELLTELKNETGQLQGIEAHWICDRERIGQFATLISRADEIMFSHPAMRDAFLSQVRFDTPKDAKVTEGLSLASLELGTADRIAFRMLPRLPNWLLKVSRVGRTFAAQTKRLVHSASGLCLIVAKDNAPTTDLLVGRVMQCAWLAMTNHSLAVQPMMSPVVLENVLQHGSLWLRRSLGAEKLAALGNDLREIAAELEDGRPAFLMRFGFAPPPTGRTARLPACAVTTTATL